MTPIKLDPHQEKRLIKAAQKERRAFAPLYQHYYPKIRTYIRHRVGQSEFHEDLTSTVFTKALEALDNFRWQGVPFSAWLYRISHNVVVDFYRKQEQRSGKTALVEDIEQLPTHQRGPEEDALIFDTGSQLKELLATLPARERKIVYMKFFEGYTNKTIARLMDLSETNVGTIVNRSVSRLRKQVLVLT